MWEAMEQTDHVGVELSVSDHSQLGSLQDYLSWAAPAVKVSRIAGRPVAGEQGALDVLAIMASSSTLVAAIKTLPDFLRSRKTSLSITMTAKGKHFSLTTSDADEIMPVLERLLDDD